MATGTMVGFLGNVPPLRGEFELKQLTAANDLITMTGAASMTADFLVLRNSAETELLYITAAGSIVWKDSVKAIFGTGLDVGVTWDGTNLIIDALADDSLIEIADSAATQLSFDVKWYGNEASGASYLYLDASANLIYTVGVDLQFKDNDVLVLGTGAGASGDVSLVWDATNLIINAAADDTVIEFGDSATTQKSFDIKIYGNAASGADYVLFDASASRVDMVGAYALGLHYRKPVEAKTANYTCLATDSGKIFTDTGASAARTFTLPAVTETGWTADFYWVSGQAMVVASAEGDNMVLFNDATADSISFATSAEIIGNCVSVVSDGTRWLVKVYLAAETATPTFST